MYLKGRADMVYFGLDLQREGKRRVKDGPNVFIPKVLVNSFHCFFSIMGKGRIYLSGYSRETESIGYI